MLQGNYCTFKWVWWNSAVYVPLSDYSDILWCFKTQHFFPLNYYLNLLFMIQTICPNYSCNRGVGAEPDRYLPVLLIFGKFRTSGLSQIKASPGYMRPFSKSKTKFLNSMNKASIKNISSHCVVMVFSLNNNERFGFDGLTYCSKRKTAEWHYLEVYLPALM